MKASTIFTVLAGICLLTSCTDEVNREDTAIIPDEQPISKTVTASVFTTASITTSTVQATVSTAALHTTTALQTSVEVQTSDVVQETALAETEKNATTVVSTVDERSEPVLVLPDGTDADEIVFPLIPLE